MREGAAAKAEGMLREELLRLGWSAEQLAPRRKGYPQKPWIAQRLRRESTMTLAWIVERLHLGAPSHLACLLYHGKKEATREATSENTLF